MLVFFSFSGCKKNNYTIATTSDLNITDYLAQHPDQFSEFSSVLKRSEISGVLNAYGTYTIFAPDNDAVKLWLKDIGKSSVQEVPVAELKDLVRYHLFTDTITTSSFTDGKIPVLNQYGQYLITGVSTINGVSSIQVNRSANMISSNIITGNGVIHVLDRVLIPAKLTLAQLIEQNPSYSIFTQALKETGFYDTLNHINGSHRWLTAIAESDSSFHEAGFSTYAALKTRYSTKNDPLDPADSLHLFVAYHLLPDIKYLADIVSASSHETLALNEVITTKLNGESILINEDTFNDVVEKGVLVNRAKSDFQASNGTLHELSGNLNIKLRVPYAIYWDPADQPEIRKLVSVFRKSGQKAAFSDPEQFEGMKWQGGDITYNSNASSASDAYVYDDFLSFYIRSAVTQWIEFTTPFIVKGRYKIWICYRRARSQTIQIQFDDVAMQNVVLAHDYYPVNETDNGAEALGFKRFVVTAASVANNVAKLSGIVEVKTSGKHKIKFVALSNESGSANTFNLDMIHIIPYNIEQKWPRFNRDGTQVNP
ncbi:fasciclin domain-containing protein [Pedobacter sp. AW31-3R]|uniref:fasciclin domain-containing protein n=1 Tax=Pedobacter sp. AW31-3R TaxID=3445781 RepID=UPI003FA123FC